MTPNLAKAVLTPAEAAVYLGVDPSMLKRWRSTGTGPRYLPWGQRTIRYRLADLDGWLESQRTAGNVAEALRLLAG